MLTIKSGSLRTFPDCWKLAHVLPLCKKDDPSVTSNNRPVSPWVALQNFWKNHLNNYLYPNNLFYKFYKYYTGFLPGHSTVYKLLETYHSIAKTLMMVTFVVWFSVICPQHLIGCGTRALYTYFNHMESRDQFSNGLQVF